MPDSASAGTSALLPLGERSRVRRLAVVAGWIGGIAIVVAFLGVLGVDVVGWLESLWDILTEISLPYLVAGLALQTVQTTLTAVGWYAILRAGYPGAPLAYRHVLAAYAAGIALNGFLPANIGTLVMLLMFLAIVAGATLPGVLGAMVVQKIFFTVAGTAVYLYLFLSVPGSFELQLGLPHDHPVLVLSVVVGGLGLLVVLGRIFWRKLQGLWANAKEGGAILATPRRYTVRVVAPSFAAWVAKLGVIAVFLAAYSIPVTFHTVMSVVGGNSLANTVSATPGGIGVNQAVNAAALNDVTDTATATAYSIGQQLAVTAWNVVFALAVVVWAFGWTGGRQLVEESYADAKAKAAEQKAERAARREAKSAEGTASRDGRRLLRRRRLASEPGSDGHDDGEARP
ncbi:MAG TPA: lysylphosphatidylglycerol synthase transmembrane domain-containing protein [Gaiellaceae bacterium]|nr:lysylphosphatidylglycerol synthase transmembrane domain-containing protein [Gaiellaceae bacterium]